ncbi:unnamed protein product [Camellia sinensis]
MEGYGFYSGSMFQKGTSIKVVVLGRIACANSNSPSILDFVQTKNCCKHPIVIMTRFY